MIILYFYCFIVFSVKNELIKKKIYIKEGIRWELGFLFVENIIENYFNIFKEVFLWWKIIIFVMIIDD